jgi:hypothetical protein
MTIESNVDTEGMLNTNLLKELKSSKRPGCNSSCAERLFPKLAGRKAQEIAVLQGELRRHREHHLEDQPCQFVV